MISKYLAISFLAITLLLSGCTQVQVNDAMQKDSGEMNGPSKDVIQNDSMEKSDSMQKPDSMEKDSGEIANSSYKPFTKAEYNAARGSGKIIFLEFYANWCPYCARQKPINESVFSASTAPQNVAGFQVNYNDSETEASEQELAREFNITYQHTRVILKQDGSIFKKSIGEESKDQIIANLSLAGA